jgi:hypothetical protein
MSLRLYFFGLYSTIIISLCLWLLLLINVNPYQAPAWIVSIFYFTFFLFWTGVFAIFGFYLKVWASNREVIFNHLIPTLRQSAIFSLILTGLLLLEQIKVLNWWVACLFIISLLMLELFFRSKK